MEESDSESDSSADAPAKRPRELSDDALEAAYRVLEEATAEILEEGPYVPEHGWQVIVLLGEANVARHGVKANGAKGEARSTRAQQWCCGHGMQIGLSMMWSAHPNRRMCRIVCLAWVHRMVLFGNLERRAGPGFLAGPLGFLKKSFLKKRLFN